MKAQHGGWCEDAYVQGAVADCRLNIDSMLRVY